MVSLNMGDASVPPTPGVLIDLRSQCRNPSVTSLPSTV